ncbi:bacteriophage N4 adsorption protein B [compost metagenome]
MNPLVDKGVKAFQANRYAEAIAFYEQALAADVADPRLHVLLASAYHHNGQLELARTQYEVALASTDAEPILRAAQAGLAKVAQGILPQRQPSSATDQLRLPSRPRDGLMACPLCGEAMVKEACICGFMLTDSRRLGLDRVQAYCDKAEVVMFVRLGLDTYLIDRDRVCYRTANEQLATLDPRMVFRALHGIPMVNQDDLQPIPTFQSPWVAYPRPGKPGEPRPYTWEGFLTAVSEALGIDLPAPLPPFEARRLFAAYRLLAPGELSRFHDDSVRWGLSFCQGLMRATQMPVEALLQNMQGEASHFRPPHRMANSLGWDLMADGLLERDELREAITRQVEYPKPLIQLILASTPLSPEEVEPVAEAARRRKPTRPVRDRLGEILIRQGVLSRASLQDALELQARQPGTPLGEILRTKGVPERAIEEALHRQQIKDQLRYGGQARLGEILVKRGAISRQQLLDALLAQIDQPLPLGETLVRQGMASPEQVYLALEQQEMTLDALVDSERAMELKDQAPATSTLTLSIDLEKEKQRLHQLWGGLKSGFKAGVKEVKTAIEAVKEYEASKRHESHDS